MYYQTYIIHVYNEFPDSRDRQTPRVSADRAHPSMPCASMMIRTCIMANVMHHDMTQDAVTMPRAECNARADRHQANIQHS